MRNPSVKAINLFMIAALVLGSVQVTNTVGTKVPKEKGPFLNKLVAEYNETMALTKLAKEKKASSDQLKALKKRRRKIVLTAVAAGIAVALLVAVKILSSKSKQAQQENIKQEEALRLLAQKDEEERKKEKEEKRKKEEEQSLREVERIKEEERKKEEEQSLREVERIKEEERTAEQLLSREAERKKERDQALLKELERIKEEERKRADERRKEEERKRAEERRKEAEQQQAATDMEGKISESEQEMRARADEWQKIKAELDSTEASGRRLHTKTAEETVKNMGPSVEDWLKKTLVEKIVSALLQLDQIAVEAEFLIPSWKKELDPIRGTGKRTEIGDNQLANLAGIQASVPILKKEFEGIFLRESNITDTANKIQKLQDGLNKSKRFWNENIRTIKERIREGGDY